MAMDGLRDWLESQDWRIQEGTIHGNAGWYAWKTLKDVPDCVSNEKPPCLCVMPHRFDYPELRESVEVDLCGEVPARLWVKLKAYSFTPGEIAEQLPTAERVLVAAWKAACGV